MVPVVVLRPFKIGWPLLATMMVMTVVEVINCGSGNADSSSGRDGGSSGPTLINRATPAPP